MQPRKKLLTPRKLAGKILKREKPIYLISIRVTPLSRGFVREMGRPLMGTETE